jgi:hypothetical protein
VRPAHPFAFTQRATAQRVLALFALAALAAGCGSLSNARVFRASILNDTASPVVVRDCGDFCSSALLTFNLAPGQSTPINRVAGQHLYWSVTTPTGGHIGCIDLYFSSPSPGASVRISSAGKCAGTTPPTKLLGLGLLIVLTLAVVIFRRRPRG